MNNPPSVLLTAVSRVMSENDLEGSKIPTYLDEMFARHPHLASKYGKSESLVDLRFKAKYNHIKDGELPTLDETNTHVLEQNDNENENEEIEDEEMGRDCLACDKTQLMKRRARTEALRVHYGLIASGSTTINNAAVREKLRRDLGGDVLCLETVAAGIMDTFPSIVIRGICDYADSHKNKSWQELAAANAAAYAKELLGYIHPIRRDSQRIAKDVLDSRTFSAGSYRLIMDRDGPSASRDEKLENNAAIRTPFF
ncbi:hypothetical protein F4808DRAFT_402136 [Astrocystis sublimbata]|nr:hypothetical protein F4808DRAFT_402136 [Astrocystis sublimbata]